MGETKRNRGTEAECFTQTKHCVNVCSLYDFVDDKTLPWLGASPDFLIHDSTVHTASEITQQMRLVMTRIFFLSKVDGKVLLKQNHSYRPANLQQQRIWRSEIDLLFLEIKH